jgi:hypothetical protein
LPRLRWVDAANAVPADVPCCIPIGFDRIGFIWWCAVIAGGHEASPWEMSLNQLVGVFQVPENVSLILCLQDRAIGCNLAALWRVCEKQDVAGVGPS